MKKFEVYFSITVFPYALDSLLAPLVEKLGMSPDFKVQQECATLEN